MPDDFSYFLSSFTRPSPMAMNAAAAAQARAFATADRMRWQQSLERTYGQMRPMGVESQRYSLSMLGIGERGSAALRTLGADRAMGGILKASAAGFAIDLAARGLESVATEGAQLAAEIRSGKTTFSSAMGKAVQQLPVIGSSIRAGLAIGRWFVGDTPDMGGGMGGLARIDAERAIADEQAARARQAEAVARERRRREEREQWLNKAAREEQYRIAGEEGIHAARMKEAREAAEERAEANRFMLAQGLGVRSAKLEAASAAVGAGLLSPQRLVEMQLQEELQAARVRGASAREMQLMEATAGLRLMGMRNGPVEGGVPTEWNPQHIGRAGGGDGGRISENTATTNRLLEEANRYLRELSANGSGSIDL